MNSNLKFSVLSLNQHKNTASHTNIIQDIRSMFSKCRYDVTVHAMCPVTEFAVASHLNTANSCCHHVFLRHFRFQKCLPVNSNDMILIFSTAQSYDCYFFVFIRRSFPETKNAIMKFHKYPGYFCESSDALFAARIIECRPEPDFELHRTFFLVLPYLKNSIIYRSPGHCLSKTHPLFIQHVTYKCLYKKIEYGVFPLPPFGTAKMTWTGQQILGYTCL